MAHHRLCRSEAEPEDLRPLPRRLRRVLQAPQRVLQGDPQGLRREPSPEEGPAREGRGAQGKHRLEGNYPSLHRVAEPVEGRWTYAAPPV